MPRPPGQQKRCRKGRRWREGVTFGGHSHGVENVPEPRRPHQGGGSGRRKRLPRLCYAHRQPSPGRGLNTHRDKARAGWRGDTWQGAQGVRRRPSGRPSRQKIRLRRGVRDGRGVGSHRIRSVGAGPGCETVP